LLFRVNTSLPPIYESKWGDVRNRKEQVREARQRQSGMNEKEGLISIMKR